MTPANPLENSVGHFWGILNTRDYMRARYAFVEALLKIKTLDAVKFSAGHLRDMLRLCRSDNMGVRSLLPALYLRLGQDQDCYDFIKWWTQQYYASDYDYGDTTLPYLDIRNANVFESPEYLCEGYPDLSHLACVVLLKVKLLVDLKALQHSVSLDTELPQELVDKVRQSIPRSEIIRKDGNIISRIHDTNLIQDLVLQIETLFAVVNKVNSYFWAGLTHPDPFLDARPEAYSHGSIEEMEVKLQYCFDSWKETPGAMEFVKAKVDAANRRIDCQH